MNKLIGLLSLSLMLSACTNDTSKLPTSSSSSTGSSSTSQPEPEDTKKGYVYDSRVEMYWPTPVKKGETNEVSKNLTQKNYYIVYDGSGSMQEKQCGFGRTREEVAKDAMVKFVDQIPSDANLGLIIFDTLGAREAVTLGENNKTEFLQAIKSSQSGDGTPLRSAIKAAVNQLGVQARKQLGYGEYHLIVVTDGEANSGEDPENIVNFTVKNTPVALHTIGFCIGESHSLNQPGKTDYKSAESPEGLAKSLKAVLAESEKFSVDKFDK